MTADLVLFPDVTDALPDGWEVVRLDKAYTFTKKPRGLDLHAYPKIPFVPMEMVPIGVEYFEQYELRPADAIGSGTYFEPGDILLSKITPSFENGKQGIIEHLPTPFGYATTEVIPIKAIPGRSDQLFLFYYLLRHSVRSDLAGKMEGTTGRQRLNKSALESLEIPLPPLAEQRAIAASLRAAQASAQARRRAADLERERKAALMQALFTRGTRGEPTKLTEIGEVPEGWEIYRLRDLLGEGFIQTGPFGSQLHASDYQPSGIPVINPTHLRFNYIDESELPFIDKSLADTLSKHYLQKGDILISRRGDFSRYSFVGDKYVGWFCGTGCLLIRVKNPAVDNFFLSVSMSTELSQKYLENNSVGSIMPNLNTQILFELPFLLPPLAEQREIAEALRACDAAIAGLEREAALHEELFRALLEELMTGRMRVPVEAIAV